MAVKALPSGYENWRGATIVLNPDQTYENAEETISALASGGCNFIRLQISGARLVREMLITKEECFLYLEDCIFNIYHPLFIEYGMQWFMGGETNPTNDERCQDRIRSDYWNEEITPCVQDLRDFASWMARTFKDLDSNILIGYQTVSEPATSGNQDVPNWYIPDGTRPTTITEDLLAETRAHDTEKFYIWSRGPWAKWFNYPDTEPLDDDKIIYNVHSYHPGDYTEQCSGDNPCHIPYPGSNPDMEEVIDGIVDFGTEHNVPIIFGAFGCVNWVDDRVLYYDDIYNYIDSRSITVQSTMFNYGAKYKGFDQRYWSDGDEDVSTSTYYYDLTNDSWLRAVEYWHALDAPGDNEPPSVITDFNASDDRVQEIKCTWSNATGTPPPTYDIYADDTLLKSNVVSPFIEPYVGAKIYYVKAINSEGISDSNTNEGLGVPSEENELFINGFNEECRTILTHKNNGINQLRLLDTNTSITTKLARFDGSEQVINTNLVLDGSASNVSAMVAFTYPENLIREYGHILNTYWDNSNRVALLYYEDNDGVRAVKLLVGNSEHDIVLDTSLEVNAICFVYNSNTGILQVAVDGETLPSGDSIVFDGATDTLFIGAANEEGSQPYKGYLVGDVVITTDIITDTEWQDYWTSVKDVIIPDPIKPPLMIIEDDTIIDNDTIIR